MMTRKQKSNFVLGTLIGGLVGSVAALLMAPQSGEKTQEMILQKGEDLRQEADNRVQDGRKYVDQKIDETRNVIADWLSNGSTLLDQKSQEIKLGNIKQAAGKEKATAA